MSSVRRDSGFTPMVQPVQPTRRIYPPPCKQCGGKGRMIVAANWRLYSSI
jgi:hypothetical protein